MFRCSTMAALIALIPAVSAGGEPSFQEVIAAMAASRAEYASYSVLVEERILLNSLVDTTGGQKAVASETAGSDTRLAYDLPNNFFHVASRSYDSKGRPGPWNVYAADRNWELRVSGGIALASDRGAELSRAVPKTIDPLAMGSGLCGDVAKGTSAQSVFANYLKWNGVQVATQDDGLIRCFRRNDYYMVVDPNRGHWPIELKDSNDGVIKAFSRLALTKVDDVWVPREMLLTCPHEVKQFRFKWESANKPLPQEVAQIEGIAASYKATPSNAQMMA